MKKVELQVQSHLEIDNIEGFFIRKVTKSGMVQRSTALGSILDVRFIW